MATKKEVIITPHAKIRAHERLGIDEEYNSLMFQVKLKDIFNKSRRLYTTNDEKKITYETVYNNKRVQFICDEDNNKITVVTILVK